MISAAKKQSTIKSYRRHDGDSGSPEVQVAVLTDRIAEINDHLKSNKHDHASRRGLVMMVGRRNRLLRYLQRTRRESYQELIKRLGLRK